MKRIYSSNKIQNWYDSRDRYFFFTSLAIVALLLVVNIAAGLLGNS